MNQTKNENVIIYYPFFDIDIQTNESHKLWLNILLLLSNNVFIPPTHLLKAKYKNLLLLDEYHNFIRNGVIFSNLYDNYNNITDYLTYKTDISNTSLLYNGKIEKIGDLFASEKSLHKVQDIVQSNKFISIVYEKIMEFEKSSDDIKYVIETLENSIENKILYRDRLNYNVDLLYNMNKISKITYEITKQIITESYYLAGTTYNKAIIPQFDKQSKLSNGFYDPVLFINVLKRLHIIVDENDIINLPINEIINLRSSKEFISFINEYQSLFTLLKNGITNDSLYFNKKEKTIKKYENIADTLIKIGLLPLTFSLNYLLNLKYPELPSIILFLIEQAIIYSFPKIPGMDFLKQGSQQIQHSLMCQNDKFIAFCQKIEKVIRENN